jgi:hypothetical protein
MPERGRILDHLRLVDLSDREILLIMKDLSQGVEDGWVLAIDVADRLGMRGDHPHRKVASRLAWLRRYGAVERELLYDELGQPLLTRKGEHRAGQRWRPTEIGDAIALGALKRAQERALEGLNDEQLLLVARHVAERARGASSATSSKMIEREWKHRWLRQNGNGR